MTSPAGALLQLGSATLGESGATALSPRIRPMWDGATLAAPAFAVRCAPGDNLAIHAAAAEAPAGSVLCVQNEGHDQRGSWGEVLTTGAMARGIVGLVIDGGVRDSDALERHGFPVFATGLVLRGASKDQPGTIGGTAVVGDVAITTGDWIVADRDGVVAISAGRLDDVRAAGEAREAKEATMFEALRTGSTTVDLLGLDTSIIERS